MNHVLCTVHIFKIDAEIQKPYCCWSRFLCSYRSSVSDTTVFQKFRYAQSWCSSRKPFASLEGGFQKKPPS